MRRARPASLAVPAWLAVAHACAGCGGGAARPAEVCTIGGPVSLVEAARGRPDAVIDLGDVASAAQVSAAWRYAPVALEEVAGVDPGPDERPVPSATARALDLSLRPGRQGWDGGPWEPFAPPALGTRHGHGHLSMGWVRVEVVIPERLGELALRGATVAFEITADDYGEVWVNGRARHRVGERGGHVVSGWNAPNRVVLTTSAEPDQRFDVATLVVNGPISRSPGNFHWVRQAVLDVYAAERAPRGPSSPVEVERRGPEMDAFVPEGAALEELATGFEALGPLLWEPDERALLVSDVGADRLYRFDPATGVLSIAQTHVGGTSRAAGRGGVTAMGLDAEGRLVVVRGESAELARYERNGAITVLSGDGARIAVQRLQRARERTLATAVLGGVHALVVTEGDEHVVGAEPREWLATDRGVALRVRDTLLGTIRTPEPVRGLALGDEDGRTLYLATRDRLWQVRLTEAPE